jgi:CHAT domain-containing protein
MRPVALSTVITLLLSATLGLSRATHAHDGTNMNAAFVVAEAAASPSKTGSRANDLATAARLIGLADLYEVRGEYAKALPLYKRALTIQEKVLGPRDAPTVSTLKRLASTLTRLNEHAKAAPLYERVLAILENAPDPDQLEIVDSLNDLAFTLNELGQYAKALPLYERALSIRESSLGRFDPATADSLGDVAYTYIMLGQYSTALPLLERSLAIREQFLPPDHLDVAGSLNYIGLALSRSGQNAKAVPILERVAAIREKALGPHQDTAWSLSNLAYAYALLGEFDKAKLSYERVVAMREKVLGSRNPDLATSLDGLAFTYDQLGQYAQALPLNKRALAIRESVQGPDHPDTATSLDALAYTLHLQGQEAKVLPLDKRVLAIFEKSLGPEHPYTATVLHNVAYTHSELGQYGEALSLDQQALRIQEKLFGAGDPRTARTLVGLARTYRRTGDLPRALAFLRRAESAAFADDARLASGQVSYELSQYYAAIDQREVAIFYSKQAVNTVQRLREENRALVPELQRSLLEKHQKIYQQLAGWLIAAGRLAEAQQVLAMLKQDEYFEFIRRDTADTDRIVATYTGSETEWARRYDEIGGQVAALGRELAALRFAKSKGALEPEQEQRLAQLQDDMATASRAFDAMVALMVQDLRSAQAQDVVRERIDTFSALREVLGEMGEGVVLLHYVPLPQRTHIILTTTEVQLAREANVGEEVLNQKIAGLREVLQNPRRDPRPLAQELYRLLLRPVAVDLEQAGAKTVMLSLNGNLRYLPFAALYDGKQYLVERYALALYTDAAAPNLKERRPTELKVWGLGLTRATQGFNALPNVKEELEKIIGAVPGEAYIDEAFTAAKLREGVDRAYPVLHIASHFRFTPGTEEDSYLVLGDGSHLTLAQVRHEYRFGGVDLMTLSACDSGFGGGRASDGREVEGLGALAQKRGAHGVLAALWPVADQSTAQLMPEMYRLREEQKLSKAKALQQAQIEFIHGGSTSGGRTGSPPAERPSAAHPQAPFSHPYFWAPFILMGNWL